MSLVADYGSDSSSEEETNVQNEVETGTTTAEKSLLSSLPPLSKSKRNGPVKILVDLPKLGNDDDTLKDQVSKKSSPSVSGLFALLPAPKRPATGKEQLSSMNKLSNLSTKPTTASTSFVPHTLTKRKSTTQKTSNLSQSLSKIKGKELDTQNEDEKEDSTVNDKFKSFFPLGAEITNIIPSKVIEDEFSNSDKIESSNIESNVGSNIASESYCLANDYNYNYNYNYNYQWDASTSSYMEYPGYYDESQLQQSNEQQPDNQIDDEVIQKLGGRRGKEGPIIIKEINAADQMADAWQAQMSELTKPGKVGSGGAAHLKPTKGQKRKHNLMYLAYQAAAMENDLKEQFAVNKKTKRETQAKYGF